MTADSSDNGILVKTYRQRIGTPSTGDEAGGYWLFALGAVLGVVGLLMFLGGGPATAIRQWAIALAAAGLALVFAGPIVRLPLRRSATILVAVGGAVCAVAILWFLVTYPDSWSTRTGQPTIIGLYGAGLLLMSVAGVFIPVLTEQAGAADRAAALADELSELREVLAGTEADEADLAAVVADLRAALAGADDAEAALQETVAQLRAEGTAAESEADDLREALAGTEADEADLAAELRRLQSSQGRFELYEDRGGQWRWRLRHRNGNVVADSGEGYTRFHNAQKGMRAVRRDALGATALVIESEADLPDEEEAFDPVEESGSQGTFEVYEDDAGEWRWRLRHENGNVIGDGGEGYSRRSSVDEAVERIRTHVGPAAYLHPDPTAFEVYRDRGGQWRWRLVHRNGNILGDSGEGYTRRRDARRALDRIREALDSMTFEVYEDRGGEFRWRLEAANGELVADSGQGYADRSGAEEAVERVREYIPAADALDIGRAAFEVYEDQGEEWRWRLRHRNGQILADGGQGYADRSGAWRGIESVKRNAPDADVDAPE